MQWRTKFIKFVMITVATSASVLPLWADSSSREIRSAGWTWPPYIIVPLVVTALLYAVGISRMRRRASRIQILPIAFFAAGWFSLLLALDSPIHEISEQLFWVHMTQHEILMVISAPLLVLSQPAASLLFALPDKWRVQVGAIARVNILRRSWLAISSPLAAWLLHAVALWIWHAPTLFVAALQNELAHAAQHISFLGTALLFWWTLFHNHAGRLGYGGAILYLF